MIRKHLQKISGDLDVDDIADSLSLSGGVAEVRLCPLFMVHRSEIRIDPRPTNEGSIPKRSMYDIYIYVRV